jgi:hypothetical protein
MMARMASDPGKKPSQNPPGSKSEREPVPLTPVRPKIGETSGNLKKRGEAFARRHGKTK